MQHIRLELDDKAIQKLLDLNDPEFNIVLSTSAKNLVKSRATFEVNQHCKNRLIKEVESIMDEMLTKEMDKIVPKLLKKQIDNEMSPYFNKLEQAIQSHEGEIKDYIKNKIDEYYSIYAKRSLNDALRKIIDFQPKQENK